MSDWYASVEMRKLAAMDSYAESRMCGGIVYRTTITITHVF